MATSSARAAPHPLTNYIKVSKLGEGGYGQVFLALHKASGKSYVLKEMDVSHVAEYEEAIKEVKFLQNLKHPNIVQYKEYFELRPKSHPQVHPLHGPLQPDKPGTHTNSNSGSSLSPRNSSQRRTLYIVMTYADGGDLERRIKEKKDANDVFPEQQIVEWILQMCLGLKHIHDNRILHRDIKSRNIFLTSNNIVKIGDFGIARSLNSSCDKALTNIGTPYYLSPERCEGLAYDQKADVWSVGIILYELMCLHRPFEGDSIKDLLCKIMDGVYNPMPNRYSSDLRQLCSSLLSPAPENRPSMNDVLRLPFMQKYISAYLLSHSLQEEFSQCILHGYRYAYQLFSVNGIQPPAPPSKPGVGGGGGLVPSSSHSSFASDTPPTARQQHRASVSSISSGQSQEVQPTTTNGTIATTGGGGGGLGLRKDSGTEQARKKTPLSHRRRRTTDRRPPRSSSRARSSTTKQESDRESSKGDTDESESESVRGGGSGRAGGVSGDESAGPVSGGGAGKERDSGPVMSANEATLEVRAQVARQIRLAAERRLKDIAEQLASGQVERKLQALGGGSSSGGDGGGGGAGDQPSSGKGLGLDGMSGTSAEAVAAALKATEEEVARLYAQTEQKILSILQLDGKTGPQGTPIAPKRRTRRSEDAENSQKQVQLQAPQQSTSSSSRKGAPRVASLHRVSTPRAAKKQISSDPKRRSWTPDHKPADRRKSSGDDSGANGVSLKAYGAAATKKSGSSSSRKVSGGSASKPLVRGASSASLTSAPKSPPVPPLPALSRSSSMGTKPAGPTPRADTKDDEHLEDIIASTIMEDVRPEDMNNASDFLDLMDSMRQQLNITPKRRIKAPGAANPQQQQQQQQFPTGGVVAVTGGNDSDVESRVKGGGTRGPTGGTVMRGPTGGIISAEEDTEDSTTTDEEEPVRQESKQSTLSNGLGVHMSEGEGGDDELDYGPYSSEHKNGRLLLEEAGVTPSLNQAGGGGTDLSDLAKTVVRSAFEPLLSKSAPLDKNALDTLQHKAEALRAFLVTELGEDVCLAAVRTISRIVLASSLNLRAAEQNTFNVQEYQRELSSVLSPAHMRLVPLVQQLVLAEHKLYQAQFLPLAQAARV